MGNIIQLKQSDQTKAYPKTVAEAVYMADGTSVEEEIKNIQDTAYITSTASGDIAVFSDGAAADAKSVVINIEPIQSGSGDPSPDNICPISGRTGAKIHIRNQNIAVFEGGYGVNTNGTITPNASRSATLDPIEIKDGVRYYWWSPNRYACIYAVWNENTLIRRIAGVASGSVLNTSGGNKLYVCGYSGQDINVVPEDCMASINTAPSAYAPQIDENYTVSWETEAGTIYGGYVDVVSGKLTVDKVIVDLGSLTWQYRANNIFSSSGISDYKYSNNVYAICSNYKFIGVISSFEYIAENKTVALYYNASVPSARSCYIKDSSYSDAATFKEAMSGVQLCYELATPLDYQLTPQQLQTLYGDNVVWSDAGSVDVEYRADAKSYINSLFSSIQSNIAFIEDGTTASRAYTVGQYVIVNGTMYKVSAGIASGATFTPGTNITATTVGTELTALNA